MGNRIFWSEIMVRFFTTHPKMWWVSAPQCTVNLWLACYFTCTRYRLNVCKTFSAYVLNRTTRNWERYQGTNQAGTVTDCIWLPILSKHLEASFTIGATRAPTLELQCFTVQHCCKICITSIQTKVQCEIFLMPWLGCAFRKQLEFNGGRPHKRLGMLVVPLRGQNLGLVALWVLNIRQ